MTTKILSHEERTNRATLMLLYFAGALCVLAMSVVAFAAEVGPVMPSVADSAAKVGWASGLLAILLQIAKTPVLGSVFAKIDPGYQAAVVLVISGVASVIEAVGTGKPLLQSALEWLFTATNAMAIYTVVFKPFKKKEPAKLSV